MNYAPTTEKGSRYPLLVDMGAALMAELAESVLAAIGPVPAIGATERSVEKDILEKGLMILPAYYGNEAVQSLRAEVDRLFENKKAVVWSDQAGSDRRYFGADRHSPMIRDFLCDKFIQDVGKHYTRTPMSARLSLAAKMVYRPGNRGSGGGWHRDSPIRRQFKALIYLSDVDKGNGPFEYLIGTHRKKCVLDLISKRLQHYRQYRFSDEQIEEILKRSGIRKQRFVGKAGDVALVDTKGIHRGAPMLSGERYALTNYYWGKTIPEHFSKDLNR